MILDLFLKNIVFIFKGDDIFKTYKGKTLRSFSNSSRSLKNESNE